MSPVPSLKSVLSLSAVAFISCASEAAEVISSTESAKIVRYSREEVSKESQLTFIKSRDLSDVIANRLVLLAANVTQRQSGNNRKLADLASKSTEPTKKTWVDRLTVLNGDPGAHGYADDEGIRLHLNGQARKSLEANFKESFPIFEEIRKGVSFNLSLNSTRSKSGNGASSDIPRIRYGLVVDDIIPNKGPSLASLGTIQDTDFSYAAPATVIYSVDKLEEPTTTTVFQRPSEEVGDASSTDSLTAGIASTGLKIPRPDLTVRFDAANPEDSVSDNIAGSAMPGARVTLSQIDGLVATQVVTNSHLGKQSVTHEIKIPIKGEAAIMRKFDEKFKPVQTSALNLLATTEAPKLNVHYLHQDDKFKGELLFKHPTVDVGLTAEPRQGWKPGKNFGREGDKITLTGVHSF